MLNIHQIVVNKIYNQLYTNTFYNNHTKNTLTKTKLSRYQHSYNIYYVIPFLKLIILINTIAHNKIVDCWKLEMVTMRIKQTSIFRFVV